MAALEEDQLDFVKHLLFLGLDLHTFLTDDTRKELYASKRNEQEMTKILNSTASSKNHNDAFGPTHINKIVVRLMRDESFAWQESDTTNKQCPDRALFLWAILFNRRQLAYFFWKRGKDQLGGALCASALLRGLSDIAESNETGDLSGGLMKHAKEWERRAYDVLSVCYSRASNLTHRLLVRALSHWDSGETSQDSCTPECTGNGSRDKSSQEELREGCPTLLNMAQAYEMMEFVGHQACQTKLTAIWKSFMAPDTSLLLILLCTFLPIFIPIIRFRKKSNKISFEGNSRESDIANCCPLGFVCTLHYFYTAPIVKFFCNIAAYLVYLVIFSYFVLVQLDDGSPTMLEYITWAWLFTMILDEIRQVRVIFLLC
ncbi:transient receptor potential cation channel subfamily M member 5-like [Littorina saxatilis]|uniref:transient receptor potential cation channel subfamily M member 5-like n=1 Tax=Littorina saxatilis TaxID=31220 RepID=UPI0038B6898F